MYILVTIGFPHKAFCYQVVHLNEMMYDRLMYDFSKMLKNYIHYKVWDQITYPFLNFNDCTVQV